MKKIKNKQILEKKIIIRGINCRKKFRREKNSNKFIITYDKQYEFFGNKKIIKRRQMRISKILILLNDKIKKCDNFKKKNTKTVNEMNK